MSTPQLAIAGGKPLIAPSKHARWPVITPEDHAAVGAVLDRGILSGPYAPEVMGLQKDFADYLGSKYCLTTNSGTAALHIALAAHGIGPGDEVICPAFTFVATGLSVLHQNAIPVFVDIEPVTLGMDPKLVEAAITPRTKAIMPVHIHGTPCDLDAILAIAKKYNLKVIEDACQAHGATYQGKKVGTFGTFGAFSLQSSKNLSCGEGGLLVTDDEALADAANRARMFGENIKLNDGGSYRLDRPLDGNRSYDSTTMGWMYRTNEMSAALARSQLMRLDHWNSNAQKNSEFITSRLSQLPGITPPIVPTGSTSVYHKYRVRFDQAAINLDHVPAKRVREALLKGLIAEGVDAVLWQTQPVPGQKLFRDKVGYGQGAPWVGSASVNYSLDQYPVTNWLLDHSLCLFSQSYPITPQTTELCEAYCEAFAKVWLNLEQVLSVLPDSAQAQTAPVSRASL